MFARPLHSDPAPDLHIVRGNRTGAKIIQFGNESVRSIAKDMAKVTPLALVLTLLLIPELIARAGDTLALDIDPAPLFESISNYVPLFFGILAVAGGILIGRKIAEFVIKAIADAF